MDNLVSIVVPVYNSGKYLSSCIKSIINQTYKDLDILLVDDGSTDNSSKICDTYAQKDTRIRVFHKKNEGVSKTRNFGIDKSKGDYILFIDSDDYFDINYVKILYENLIKYDADMSMCNIVRVNESKKMIDNFDIIRKTDVSNITVLNREEYISNILDYKYYFTYATNKLIKKSIINDVRFREDIFYNEDGLFFLDISKNIDRAVFICPVYLYYYLQNTESANAQSFNEKHLTILKSFEIMENYFDIFKYNNKCYFAYRYINYFIEGNYYLFINGRISQIKDNKYKQLISKYYKYAIKSDNINIIDKIKLIFKIIFPKLMMKIKNIK